MNHPSSFHQPPYSRHWQPVHGAQHSSSSSGSTQWTYAGDSILEVSPSSYPEFVVGESPEANKSFRSTLLEIEDTFYKTFPAAAQARGWGVASAGEECSDDRDVLFSSFSQSDINASITSNSMDSDASERRNSGIVQRPAFSSSLSVSRLDVHMDDGQFNGSSYATAPHALAGAYPPHPPPTVAVQHPTYYPSSPSHSLTSMSSPVSSALYSPGPAQAVSHSPSYSTATSLNGPLSDACRPQTSFRDAQNRYTSPYVTGNLCDDIAPMASLAGFVPGATSMVETLNARLSHPPPPPASTGPASSLCQYPGAQSANVPPSPGPPSSGYYPAHASTSGSENQSNTNTQLEVSQSPEPSTPGSSITLYPVPQAPPVSTSLPIWNPPIQHVSPEPAPPAPRDPSTGPTGRSGKRKRAKDNDKKPPLACLFCRGRKIACGPPAPDGDGKTCNQCHRRSLKCDYPAESRRGMRKEKALPNLTSGGAKVVVKSTKKR